MRVALLGATSQLAQDWILALLADPAHRVRDLTLYARRPEAVLSWLARHGHEGSATGAPPPLLPGSPTVLGAADAPALAHGAGHRVAIRVASLDDFAAAAGADALLNFVGVGDPARAVAMGADIFDVTLHYDALALAHLRRHPHCRYVFLSSGAAYGGGFTQPAGPGTRASIALNDLQPQDWYAVAKLHAECRHRALAGLAIVDLRVFNYFSRSQDPAARFLICDILRAIVDGSVLQTSSDYIVRDYLHPSDFYQLVMAVLRAPPGNAALDCYSRAPIDKPSLLAAMQEQFGLRYELRPGAAGVNATGGKPHYYSTSRRAAEFGYTPSLTSEQGISMEMRALCAGVSAR